MIRITHIAFTRNAGESHPKSLNLTVKPSSALGLKALLSAGNSKKDSFPISM